jgi:hypothetical protein
MGTAWTRAGAPYLIAAVLAGIVAWPSTATALEVGEKAPDFTLPSTTGQKISLSQFLGKKNVLIEFHINDFGAT